jgi:6-phosphofructokinase 1
MHEKLSPSEFQTARMPGNNYETPLGIGADDGLELWTPEDKRILYVTETSASNAPSPRGRSLAFNAAGLHKKLHFNPENTTIGIVSCGGLCPGLNDVIKGVVQQALDMYYCKRVIGFRYGYYGLTKEGKKHTMILDDAVCNNINLQGGTMLGTSRGPQDADEMVDTLLEFQVNILICIGGDGTQRGAYLVHQAITRRGLDIGVVGIPKTIDNDIAFIERTFGFDTAVSEACKALQAGMCEAKSHLYGVGLVKLMGRHAGFIAAQATIASQSAHICLVPEHEISLDTLYDLLERRFEKRTYVVVVVAEGFGQTMLEGDAATDPSGNKKLGDIGVFLKDKITAWLKANKAKYPESTLKYIDPSYMIRSCPASSNDAAFCVQLANVAVHEAMFGSTGCLIGYWANNFTTVPVPLATKIGKRVDLQGMLWRSVREVTVSKRRGRVGALNEEGDVINATSPLAMDGEDSDGTISRLANRIEELEKLIAAVREREKQKDRQMQQMKDYTDKLEGHKLPQIGMTRNEQAATAAGPPAHSEFAAFEGDDGRMLEALENKYAQMKERLRQPVAYPHPPADMRR